MSRGIKALLLASIAYFAVLSFSAFGAGQNATLSFTMPTQYMDGSALPLADIAKVVVYWEGGSKEFPGNPTKVTVWVPCGNRSFTVAVVTSATAKYPNAVGAKSSPAVSYSSGVSCGVPKAPTGASVS